MDLIDWPELAGLDGASMHWIAGACSQDSGPMVGFELKYYNLHSYKRPLDAGYSPI